MKRAGEPRAGGGRVVSAYKTQCCKQGEWRRCGRNSLDFSGKVGGPTRSSEAAIGPTGPKWHLPVLGPAKFFPRLSAMARLEPPVTCTTEPCRKNVLVFFVYTVSSARDVTWSLFLSEACNLFPVVLGRIFFPTVPHVVSTSSRRNNGSSAVDEGDQMGAGRGKHA